MTEETPQCLTFEGGGGFLTVSLYPPEGEKTRVDLVAQEWDDQLKRFASGFLRFEFTQGTC